MSKTEKPAIRAAAERRSKSRLLSVAPGEDEPIARWGSVIQWPRAEGVFVPGKARGYFRWVVPVVCGSCRESHPAPVYDPKPASGCLSADSLRSAQYGYTRFGFTGMCRPCLTRINRPDTTYPDGTVLYHQERTKDGLPVFCGACKKKGFLTCALSETLHDKHWPCPSCGQVLGQWVHEQSGATVYWLMRAKGQRNYVEFDCAKCDLPFFCKDELPVRVEWWGLCPECRYKHHPQRVDSPLGERVGALPPKPGRNRPRLGAKVRIPCPLPGCGRLNEFDFQTTRKEGFLGLCKPGKDGHTRDQIAAFILAGGARQDADPAPPGFLEAVRAVMKRWSVVRYYPGRDFERRLKMVTQADIGPALKVRQHPEETTKNYCNRIVKSPLYRGIKEAFPGEGGGFPAFRKAVVKGIESGEAAEAVARRLWNQCLDVKKAA